jgi:hypothetical protein
MAQHAALRAAGTQLRDALDFTRHSVRRAGELVARVAASEAVATQPAVASLVRARVALAQSAVLCETMQQGVYRAKNFERPRDVQVPVKDVMLAWENVIQPLEEAEAALERRGMHSTLRFTADEQHFFEGFDGREFVEAEARSDDFRHLVGRCQVRAMVLTLGSHALSSWRMGCVFFHTLRTVSVESLAMVNGAQGRELERHACVGRLLALCGVHDPRRAPPRALDSAAGVL